MILGAAALLRQHFALVVAQGDELHAVGVGRARFSAQAEERDLSLLDVDRRGGAPSPYDDTAPPTRLQ